MNVGEVEILSVLDGHIRSPLPASRSLPDPQSVAWQEQHGMFLEDGLIESAAGAFLVRTRDRVALVDAGLGPPFPGGFRPANIDVGDPSDPLVTAMRDFGLDDDTMRSYAAGLNRIQVEQGGLLTSLDAFGVGPEEVTDLILTHLHFDHIGWVSAQGAPVFSRATVRCAAADLAYFLDGPREEGNIARIYGALRAHERLAPVLDRVETWEADGPILPGIDVRLAPGHTPGSTVVVVSDGPDRAMFLGDLVHCPLELTDDDFDFLVDHDPTLAASLRRAYAQELEGTDIPVAASHFPGLRFGRILAGGGARRWTFD